MLRMKYITGLIFLSLSTVSWSDGFYVGLGVGPQSANFSQDSSIIQSSLLPLQNFNVINKAKFAGRGVFGSLFGGYGRRFCIQGFNPNSLYLAAELNGDLSSTQFETSNSEFIHANFSKTTMKIENSYGISLLPGIYYSCNTLFYARLGYVRSHFTVDTSDTSLANVSTGLDGFRYGFGIKQNLTRKLAFRMEWSRNNYQGTSFSTLDPASLVSKTTTITPRTDKVEFALVYDIC